MARRALPDEQLVQLPDGTFRESFYIKPALLLAAENPLTVIFTKLVQHANQIGLLGKVIVEWTAEDDIMVAGGKKVTFITETYASWAERQEAAE